MLKYEAPIVFQRYYFHALRNHADEYLTNKDLKARSVIREVCAAEAFARVREELLYKIALDTSIDEITKEETWGEVMLALIQAKMQTVGIPADIADIQRVAAERARVASTTSTTHPRIK